MILRASLLLLLPALLPPGTARGQLSATDSLPITDPRLAATVVARVGPVPITAREFLLSYEFGPAFAKRARDSKRRYLDFMINEKLLALDAADRGARSSPVIRRSVAEIEGDLATEELYREDVLGKVAVREDEVQEAVAAQRMHYSIRWLYSPTRNGIDRFCRAMHDGALFDSIFVLQLGDSVTPDLRSLKTTRFELKKLRPPIAAVADTVKLHAPSAPIEGPDGWYVVWLDAVTIDAITPESELIKMRSDAHRALTQQKADSLSDIYVNQIMGAHQPVIEPRTFDFLSAYLGQFWLPKELRVDLIRGMSPDQEEVLAAISDIDRFGKSTLVRMNDRKVTLGRFLSWYHAREYVIRLRASSIPAYRFSLQQLVWQMVRDGLLIERATSRGMQERESVRTQKPWWEAKALYALEKKRMADSIVLGDGQLQKYYSEHRRTYLGPNGDTLTFEAAKESVRKDLHSFELTKRILHRLILLKRKYPVTIDAEVLRSLPVENENDPKAIDVYIAKTRGTFPHPAFPTIDYDWQTWQ